MQKTKKPSSKPTKKPNHQANQTTTQLFDTISFDRVVRFFRNVSTAYLSIHYGENGGKELSYFIFIY